MLEGIKHVLGNVLRKPAFGADTAGAEVLT
jgi:hypothetical protein